MRDLAIRVRIAAKVRLWVPAAYLALSGDGAPRDRRHLLGLLRPQDAAHDGVLLPPVWPRSRKA